MNTEFILVKVPYLLMREWVKMPQIVILLWKKQQQKTSYLFAFILSPGYQFMKLDMQHFLIIWAASWQNQQCGLCTKQRLRAAWASVQSAQSLHLCSVSSKGPKLSSCWQRRLMIRLGGWPGWSHMTFCWFYHDAAHLWMHAITVIQSWTVKRICPSCFVTFGQPE